MKHLLIYALMFWRRHTVPVSSVLARLSLPCASALALNPEFNAFIYLLKPDELEPYLAALDGVDPASLPLYGVPFAIKDNIDLAGIETTAACPAFAYRAEQDATIVSQLIALGRSRWGKPISTSSRPA